MAADKDTISKEKRILFCGGCPIDVCYATKIAANGLHI